MILTSTSISNYGPYKRVSLYIEYEATCIKDVYISGKHFKVGDKVEAYDVKDKNPQSINNYDSLCITFRISNNTERLHPHKYREYFDVVEISRSEISIASIR